MSLKARKLVIDVLIFMVTVILAVFFFFPIFFNIMSAFKSNAEIMKDAVALPASLYLESFKYLLTETNYPQAIVNSLILTVVSIVFQVLFIPMAGYAIQRRNAKWTKFVFLYFLAGMMIPFQAYMIPLFKELKLLGLYGSLAGPIMIYVAGSVGFGSLLYSSFVKGIPAEIEEAAEIDGCSRVRIFWNIVFPLLGPVTASMVVLNGLGIWNDFLMPMLVLPSGEPKTMVVEIYRYIGEFSSRWDMIFAGTTMSVVPVLLAFILLQKYFVKGIAAGATKG
ncbi:MAG: carbohydrate ABC transporter permease [Paenibacillus macerans]|uniref:Binding--dependent transport system inner membrane component family protein n=1 Tax=Paenibacillus macerans TaxID=44252 RepID=A0A090ZHI1_PAEMA|nr:carbohydrate ABC transporter permease [Paenibacillus macerans]KFN10062.1 binding--dependent transport system inner membrane component family protein [Paenibacillus macerans]MBS5912869.1 carbohydrate ABC transporter permease [Paenibacillus macerans]MCY7560933.1 carbohydrate ABC transporter permease [Paenibacillus macerans]MDU7473408.1 carbohydrate ABC transporter permease [Paenibacillus macerans]MEC0138048.1 carbohydrate ABC transporter permease [Paenibacillus macerans]